MIKQIKSFQTSDGALHPDKIKALTHEFKLELRGLFQSFDNKINLTSTDAAAIISCNSDKFVDLINKYKVAINKSKGATKRLETLQKT